jgi:hypothetical protein
MIEIASLPPAVQAGALIGVVLLEAIVLYLGYGLAERAFAEPLLDRIKSI